MSSFICTSEHFNSIDKGLKNSEIIKVLHLQNFEFIKSENSISECINELRNLNVLCVSLQYKHHYKNLDQEIVEQLEIVNSKTKSKALSPLGLFNALKCIRYQIEVEHLEELRKLSEEEVNALNFLEHSIQSLACYICSKLPEDSTNTWCI